MKRKLIEISLPHEAINKQAARQKSIRHGHPSTLHLWWARRPLGAARAVLFAQLVNDPSSRPDEFPTEDDQRRERDRLHGIIERLAKWDCLRDERLFAEAHANSSSVVERARYKGRYEVDVSDAVRENGHVPGFDKSDFEDVEW